MTIREQMEKLIEETDEFYKEEIKKSSDEVYQDHYKIYFYESIREYFSCKLEDDEDLEVEKYKKIFPITMAELYRKFTSLEAVSVDNFENIEIFFYCIY